MNNINMANMQAMGGPVGNPMAMMNNGAMVPQGGPRQQLQSNDSNRALLNTYIYEYFLRYGMYDCARAMLSSDQQIKVHKDSPGGRRDENGNVIGNGVGDDAMDTDSKDDIDKRPDDLPAPNIPTPAADSCFLYDWFCLFWDIFNAQKGGKGASNQVNQYVNHAQQQSRMKQVAQQDLLRNMRPDFSQQQQYMMRNMPNGAMMNMKAQGNNLQRAALANSQNNPQAMQALQQQKQGGQMQRDPSDMDGNRQRPSSPSSADNAPSPSKRPRLDAGAFNPNQAGMVPNGRPGGAQGMPGQQMQMPPSTQQVQQMLMQNGINPSSLNPDQLQTFTNQSPAVQAKTIATYAQNLQHHHSNQLPNKPMPNAPIPQGQGSPMVPQGPDGAALTAYYNAGEMAPGGMRPGPGGANAAGGSNHALQDYQMQLMLLEQQNKKRLMMARQEQDGMGITRPDGQPGPAGPGGPQGPNGQPFQGTSPQGPRSGASPNPAEQMKRNAQMGQGGMGSPLPEGAQSRGSPNPVNFMGATMDPNMAPNFFKGMNNMDGNMVAAQMNGMRPPNAHPGQPFAGPMHQQQMMARQQQAAAAQQGQQPPQQGQGGPQMQWQQGGPNGAQMGPQGPQAQSVQGTPQQRSMPPPSAPAAAANANQRNTSSPQTTNAAPPTPQQSNKAAPKKKSEKSKSKVMHISPCPSTAIQRTDKSRRQAASQKKSNSNLNAAATPAADAPAEAEATPATPMTPVNPAANFNKGQNAGAGAAPVNGQPAAPAPPAAAPAPIPPSQPPTDPSQTSFMDQAPLVSFDEFHIQQPPSLTDMQDFGAMDFANPLTSDNVLNDFDFDSFLHDNAEDPTFDFNTGAFMEGAGEIGTGE
ncbi:uncharacterized protein E0L32_010285 [Thyridium curvatum]|uniref:Uncharacterized protein n=1 Tax=Thyridium curvatum TaxID=1093900 RepID=A0A507AF49_9PEZI|nr:uncharacterized protein E0L32_010285 [Thyridium curvatum]TPX08085.1 hypothetical protein E0L32_010285 [Thyridium curvatum]